MLIRVFYEISIHWFTPSDDGNTYIIPIFCNRLQKMKPVAVSVAEKLLSKSFRYYTHFLTFVTGKRKNLKATMFLDRPLLTMNYEIIIVVATSGGLG